MLPNLYLTTLVLCFNFIIAQNEFIQGHKSYITLLTGNVNILISAPHGGSLSTLDMMSNVLENSTKNDLNTKKVAILVREELSALFRECNDTKSVPFLIYNNLLRFVVY